MLLQPLFRPLQLLPHIRAEAFGINRQKRRVPLALQAFLDNPVRVLASAQRNERLRRGGSNTRILAIIRG